MFLITENIMKRPVYVIEEESKETDRVQESLRIKLWIPRCAANRVADLELRTESSRWKIWSLVTKFCCRVMHMGKNGSVQVCYEC